MQLANAVLMLAVQKAKQGEQVALNLRFGKLRLSRGEVKFESEKLAKNYAYSSMTSYKVDDVTSVSRSPSPKGIIMPQTAIPDRSASALEISS